LESVCILCKPFGKITKKLGDFIPQQKNYALFLTKNPVLGYILGNFFANASGHPGWQLLSSLVSAAKIVAATRLQYFPSDAQQWEKVRNPVLVEFSTKQGDQGRCYDHNFLRFSPIFGGKKLPFSSKTNVMIKILHNLALF
jgi:hypothetical protein